MGASLCSRYGAYSGHEVDAGGGAVEFGDAGVDDLIVIPRGTSAFSSWSPTSAS